MNIYLGSKSPRRKQLLEALGYTFEIVTKDTDESFPSNLAFSEVAAFIAENKANDIWSEIQDNQAVLITSDTVVATSNEILGKPADFDDAKRMLQSLSGNTHQVYTALVVKSKARTIKHTVRTDVTFKVLSKQEINHYILEYKPFDKAGAYGIQEWIGLIGVERIEGSYNSVVGLPTFELNQLLQEIKKGLD